MHMSPRLMCKRVAEKNQSLTFAVFKRNAIKVAGFLDDKPEQFFKPRYLRHLTALPVSLNVTHSDSLQCFSY